MTENKEFLDEIDNDNNKNKNIIICQFCKSKILNPQTALFMDNEFPLPLMHQKNKDNPSHIESEIVKGYWEINDMYTFENIGFSNTVDDTKYLICADCEMGPVGYHNITTKKCFVALSRVKHVT